MNDTLVIPAEIREPKRRARPVVFLTKLFREKPLGAVGGVIVLLMLFTGIFADFLAPEGYNVPHLPDRMSPPSTQYILGTDALGRDILSRIIYGARISMIVGLVWCCSADRDRYHSRHSLRAPRREVRPGGAAVC